MRAALLVAALVFAAACTNAKGVAPVEMQTIASGSYAAAEERRAVLVKSDAEYRQQWSALIGEGTVVPVNFEQAVVIFLMAGTRNTGGWRVEPVSARVEGGTAVIDARVQGPPPGSITTQALTQPYAVITLNQRSVEKVRWD